MVTSAATVSGINYTGAIPDRIEYERLASARRGHLEDFTSAAAWPDGQSLTWEQALAYASEDDEQAVR